MDELSRAIMETNDDGQLRERVRQLMEARTGRKGAAMERMDNLDDRTQLDLETISQADLERGASRYNIRPPEYEPEAPFAETAARMERYIGPRLAQQCADHRSAQGLPTGGYNGQADREAVAEFAKAITEPYSRVENGTQEMILRAARNEVANSFAMWAILEQTTEDCGVAVTQYMRRARQLRGYEPQGRPDESERALESGGLRTSVETGDERGMDEAVWESYGAVSALLERNRGLSRANDPRAMGTAQEEHVRAIQSMLLEVDGAPGGGAEAARTVLDLMDRFEPPDWAIPGEEANDALIEQEREERTSRLDDMIRRVKNGQY